MGIQNSINLPVDVNADGFDISSGTTPRKLTVTGSDITMTGAGSNVDTFPSGLTSTLANAAFTISADLGPNGANTRSLDTNGTNIYANPNSAKSIIIMASVRCAVSVLHGHAYVTGNTDTNANPTTIYTIVGTEDGLAGQDVTVSVIFTVPAGTTYNYKIAALTSNGTCTLKYWFEIVL